MLKRATEIGEFRTVPPAPRLCLPKATPDREHWAATIRDSAKFAAGYRWRMLWGVLLTGGIASGLAYGLAQLWPHVSLAELAYWGGVKGIETARWLFRSG